MIQVKGQLHSSLLVFPTAFAEETIFSPAGAQHLFNSWLLQVLLSFVLLESINLFKSVKAEAEG